MLIYYAKFHIKTKKIQNKIKNVIRAKQPTPRLGPTTPPTKLRINPHPAQPKPAPPARKKGNRQEHIPLKGTKIHGKRG